MNKIKRQRSIDISSNEQQKKISRSIIPNEKNSITCIEDFSNELFFEIFDYLEGYTLYNAFSNLNIRFQYLLKSSSLQLKILLPSTSQFNFESYAKDFLIPNKHQIFSFHFHNILNKSSIFSWFPIDSTLINLQSLTLTGIQSNELILILINSRHLPNLFSLTIRLDQHSIDLSIIYQLIFTLPKLKYTKLSSDVSPTNLSSLMAIRSQISSIKYLIIDHSCTVNDLLTILSYTPQLTHLICNKSFKSNINNEEIKSISLFHLTHISIPFCYLSFDEFEIFIRKMSSKLQRIKFYSNIDSSYLNADRWEELFQKSIPNLIQFHFIYIEVIHENFKLIPYHKQIHRFNSTFWIQKKWLLHLEIRTCIRLNTAFIYKISPRRIRAIDLSDYKQEASIIYTPLTILNLSLPNSRTFFDIIRPILPLLPINVMNIQCNEIYINILIELIRLLPNLDFLVVNCSAIIQLKRTFNDVAKKNRITKVILQQMTELSQIQFFIQLCPYMQHLEIFYSDNIEPESIVRLIFMKNIQLIPMFNSLAICMSNPNEVARKKLHQIVYLEELQRNYIIKKRENRVYLRRIK